jgi:hypothetical protein
VRKFYALVHHCNNYPIFDTYNLKSLPMKTTLLFLSFVAFTVFNAASQSCTPGVNFQDSIFGVWPNPTENLPGATANVAYSADVNFKVPATVTAELDPSGQFVGSVIQGFILDDVVGLPAGYAYACNNSNCQYSGGANGCANIYGISGVTGTYPIELQVTATVLVVLFPGLPATPVPQNVSFEGYEIIIGNAGIIEGIIAPLTIHPNPSSGIININGITSSMNASSVSIRNLDGKVIAQKQLDGSTTCSFDLAGVVSGIYFAAVSYDGGINNIKFIVD